MEKTLKNNMYSDQKIFNFRARFIRLIPYIYCFFIFAFLGWAIETIYCYIGMGEWVKRGFLYATICPIYGWGALILTTYLDKSKKKINYFKLFILFICIFSVFEYLVGFLLDALFAERWWDYSDDKYNLNGRITIVNSFFWGVITVAFSKFVYPLIHKAKEKVLIKIPITVQVIIAILLLAGILVDSILSCVKYLK